jgi:2-polyprenyl-3-methyl-5-hydroxy-6-metoxy-1,4-benzoquinol methylase
MAGASIESKVASHYSRGDVTERILRALGLKDAAPGTVPVRSLFPVDQLHHGGIALTEKMAKAAGIAQGMRILDAGSGIGGSARYLADRFHCSVEAVDLSEKYVATARDLDKLVGLSGSIAHRTASVTDLPFQDESFDVVWCQNVTMNVPDKHAMFSEARRMLRPGGVYVLSHIGEGRSDAIEYPLPWAMTAEMSFTTPPSEFLQLLADAGFVNVTDHAEGVPPGPPPADQPDDLHAMGDDMPRRRANSGRAVADGNLIPMLVTARR